MDSLGPVLGSLGLVLGSLGLSWGGLAVVIAIYLQKMPFDIFSTLKYYREFPFDIPFDMARKAVAPYKSEPVLAPGPLLGFQVDPKPLANIELAIFGPLQTDFELPN